MLTRSAGRKYSIACSTDGENGMCSSFGLHMQYTEKIPQPDLAIVFQTELEVSYQLLTYDGRLGKLIPLDHFNCAVIRHIG